MDRRTMDVAAFEFRSFFDFKGELISLAILALIAAIRFGGDAIMALSVPTNLVIAVESTSHSLPDQTLRSRFSFVITSPHERKQALERIDNGQIAGLLAEEPNNTFRLYTKSRVFWTDALATEFLPIHRWLSTIKIGVDHNDIERLVTPPQIVPSYPGIEEKAGGLSAYISTISIMVIIIIGIISTLPLLLQGIAGEKFGRISEIVLSAISVPTWIDGKVIAAALHGLKTMLSYTIYGLTLALLLGYFGFDQITDPDHWRGIAFTLISGTLGLLFWIVLFALVAALLPNAKSPIRNTLVLAPMTCLLLCLNGAKEPDNSFIVALSFFPPTMPFSMPLRIASGTASTLEFLASMAFAIASLIALRLILLRVFTRAILNVGGKINGVISYSHKETASGL